MSTDNQMLCVEVFTLMFCYVLIAMAINAILTHKKADKATKRDAQYKLAKGFTGFILVMQFYSWVVHWIMV